MTDKTEAQQRVQAYIDRRKQSRGLDKNHIHGFDAGDSSEAVLLTSDLEALLGEIQQLKVEKTEMAALNFENYEFQRKKADAATATVYRFHYAMKDAGWHPGRTDDDLTEIIRAKGRELAQLSARQAAPTGLTEAVFQVLEGWNIPAPVRKILETAYYAPPPPEREPLSDDQWQALADALDGIINRELKDKISTILQLPTE